MTTCSALIKSAERNCKKKSVIEGLCRLHANLKKEPTPLKDITPQPKDTKKNFKKIKEEEQLDFIVDNIKRHTPTGLIIKDEFFKTFGKEIEDIRKEGGQRKDHFDFLIKIKDEGWKKVEHKGSSEYKKIDNNIPPWITGVQFFNGTGNNFSLGRIYSERFYKKYIENGYVSRKYNILSKIPTYAEWATDIFKQGRGRNKFIIELREKCVDNKPARLKGLYKEREEFTKIFNASLSEDDIRILKNEVFEMANKVLSEKHYWIQIHGDLNDKFYVKWSPQFMLEKIDDFEILESLDCRYKFKNTNCFNIEAHLRWGFNQGITNLRMDLK